MHYGGRNGKRHHSMAQAGNFTQPPQQLYRQVLDAAGSSETGRLYRFAGDCGEAALAPAAAEVKQVRPAFRTA